MIPGLFSALLAAGLHAGEIAVRSDASVELAGAAQFFCPAESDPEDYRRPVGEELELVRARFPKGRCVPARKGFSFSARAAALLALGPRPEFSHRRETAKEAEDAAGGSKAFEAWIADLRAFARGEAKIEAHIVPEAVAAVSAAEKLVKSWRILERFEAYAGYAMPGEQSLVLSSYLKREAVYNVVEKGADGLEIYTIASAASGIGTQNDHWGEGLGLMLLHEAGHGFLDGMAELFAAEISARRPKGFKDASCYGSWRQCVKEHAASAAAARMALVVFPDEGDEEDGEPPPGASRKETLPYLNAAEAALAAFETDRARRPTLKDAYPAFLDALKPDGSSK